MPCGTAWTGAYEQGQEIVVPLKNGEGGYVADERTLDELEAEGRVVARYLDVNPNGSRRDIAGISNAAGNVVGLMPHPEHAVEVLTGPSTDGLPFFTSVLRALVGATALVTLGIAKLDHPLLEHHGDVITGLGVAAMGVAIFFLPLG